MLLKTWVISQTRGKFHNHSPTIGYKCKFSHFRLKLTMRIQTHVTVYLIPGIQLNVHKPWSCGIWACIKLVCVNIYRKAYGIRFWDVAI